MSQHSDANGQCDRSRIVLSVRHATTHIDDALRQAGWSDLMIGRLPRAFSINCSRESRPNFGYTYRRFGNFSVTQNQA